MHIIEPENAACTYQKLTVFQEANQKRREDRQQLREKSCVQQETEPLEHKVT